MQIEEIFHFSATELLKVPGRLWAMVRGGSPLQRRRLPARLAGLLDTSPLERIVLGSIPWKGIRQNLKAGLRTTRLEASMARMV